MIELRVSSFALLDFFLVFSDPIGESGFDFFDEHLTRNGFTGHNTRFAL
jgi:hypothetical protein